MISLKFYLIVQNLYGTIILQLNERYNRQNNVSDILIIVQWHTQKKKKVIYN